MLEKETPSTRRVLAYLPIFLVVAFLVLSKVLGGFAFDADNRLAQHKAFIAQQGGFQGTRYEYSIDLEKNILLIQEFRSQRFSSKSPLWWEGSPPHGCVGGEPKVGNGNFFALCATSNGVTIFSQWKGLDFKTTWKDRSPRLVPLHSTQPQIQLGLEKDFEGLLDRHHISYKKGSSLELIDFQIVNTGK